MRFSGSLSIGLQVVYGPSILIETVDAQSLSVGETVTLMEWGNAVVVSITRDKFTVWRCCFALV